MFKREIEKRESSSSAPARKISLTIKKGKSTAVSLNHGHYPRITDAECGSTSSNLFGPNGGWVISESQITSSISRYFHAPLKACQPEGKQCWQLHHCFPSSEYILPLIILHFYAFKKIIFRWAVSFRTQYLFFWQSLHHDYLLLFHYT